MKIIWFWEKNRKTIYRHDDDGKLYFARALHKNSLKENAIWFWISEESDLYQSLVNEFDSWFEVPSHYDITNWCVNDIVAMYDKDAYRADHTKYYPNEWNHVSVMPKDVVMHGEDVCGITRFVRQGDTIFEVDDKGVRSHYTFIGLDLWEAAFAIEFPNSPM